ncbi:MAG: hypothetical protein E6J40_04920 [Chloroflexi bacterium]|nr:MAG: hypothetical protein E6J40_04920 [Chloroflexota bacterium]
MASRATGAVVLGGVTKAVNEYVPTVVLYATWHLLDLMQAPTIVPVVLSKISIAEPVPVTLLRAVAVNTTDSPAPISA